MTNISRIQPCPCNSGKLYKECHMREFRPKEGFKVKPRSRTVAVNYHMERDKDSDEWVKVPERLFVMVGYAEKSYNDIDNVVKDFNEYIPEVDIS